MLTMSSIQALIQGDRPVKDADELSEIELHAQELITLGFKVNSIVLSLNASTSFNCDLLPGRTLSVSRAAAQETGFDLVGSQAPGGARGWTLKKRTTKGTGWA
jgi:hypothetical protein